jgi:hypothetical protein
MRYLKEMEKKHTEFKEFLLKNEEKYMEIKEFRSEM